MGQFKYIVCIDRCPASPIYAPTGTYTATADWGDGVVASSPPFAITVPACTASDVALSLASDRSSYAPSQPVKLTATVVPRLSTTCSMPLGGASPTFTASDGALQAWNSCATGCSAGSTFVLGPRNTARMSATWDRSTCPAGGSCTPAPAGTYTVTAD